MGVTCALLLVAVGSSPALVAKAAASPCQTAAPVSPPIREVPWAQRWFAPDRVWPITAGDGVTVAIIDTGVDAGHPQLSEGGVQRGVDLLGAMPGGNVDCDAHGTAVASLIAASNETGIGFTGLAPGVEILPVRVADQHADPADTGEDTQVDPTTFARGLRWAVEQGARVINVSIVFHRQHDVIREAVQDALDEDVVVVAAVGDRPATDGPGPAPAPYPAAYDGVIGVGAIVEDGSLAPTSAVGGFVDLVAPGAEVTAATRRDGHQRWTGTSFAAPFVSASAALLLAATDDNRPAAEVSARLYATADPAGPRDQYGHGVVNPYRALTERTGSGDPVAARSVPRITTDPRAQARAARWQRDRRMATVTALAVLGLGVLGALAIPIVARGRRRGWSPTQWESPPVERPAIDEPEQVFFSVPGQHSQAPRTRTGGQ